MVANAASVRPAPSEEAPPIDRPAALRAGRRRTLAVVALTLLAAGLRLWRLDSIPAGFHGDEAHTGLEALRVLRQGWIGPWATSTLGWPAGHLYWTAAFVALFGPSVTSVRLALACWGIAAVPLGYVVFRSLFGWRVGMAAAAILAVSVWSVHLTRTGFSSPPWPVFEIAAIGVLFAAMRGRPLLFGALGLVAGIGVYFYILVPWSLALLGSFAVGWWALDAGVRTRRNAFGLLAAGLVAVIVALPMIHFALTETDTFLAKYRRNTRRSVFLVKDLEGAGLAERAAETARSIGTYGVRLFVKGRPDHVDAVGVTRPVDAATGILCLFGLLLAFQRRREPAFALLLFLFFLLPLPAALNTQGQFRGSFGLLPVIAALAALPVGALWREADRAGPAFRRGSYALMAICALLVAAWNVRAYFVTFARSEHARWVYAADFRAAVDYAKTLSAGTKIYFLAHRWSWDYAPRKLLAPDLAAENRSREFGTFSLEHDGGGPAVFLLLNQYRDLLPELRERYPRGKFRPAYAHRLRTPFIAFHVGAAAP